MVATIHKQDVHAFAVVDVLPAVGKKLISIAGTLNLRSELPGVIGHLHFIKSEQRCLIGIHRCLPLPCGLFMASGTPVKTCQMATSREISNDSQLIDHLKILMPMFRSRALLHLKKQCPVFPVKYFFQGKQSGKIF